MINRRQLMWGGLGLVSLAGLGVFAFGRAAAESEIAAVVRRRLSFLRLDEAGVQAFAKDQAKALLAKRPSVNRMKYHFLSAFAPSFKRYDHSSDARSRIARIEDGFVSTFLLSSDFFRNGSDESRVVRYVELYDPLRPCGNPFARPAIDA